jgi:hypothetical protein
MEYTDLWRSIQRSSEYLNVDDNITSAAEEYDYDLFFDGIIHTPESSSIEEEISSDLGDSLG